MIHIRKYLPDMPYDVGMKSREGGSSLPDFWMTSRLRFRNVGKALGRALTGFMVYLPDFPTFPT